MSTYKVVIEKEYYPLSLDKKEPVIGCLMMKKNGFMYLLKVLHYL